MEQSLVHEFMVVHAMALKEIDGLLVNKLLLVSMMNAWEVSHAQLRKSTSELADKTFIMSSAFLHKSTAGN